MFAGHRAAYLEYRHQVICVGIDIYNLEAEAYGAKVELGEGDAIPAIHKPLLTSLDDGLTLKPFDPQRDGRIAMTLAVAEIVGSEDAAGVILIV